MKRSTVIASLGVALFALLLLSSLTLRNSPFLSGSVTTPTYFWTREIDDGNHPKLASYNIAIEIPTCALGLTIGEYANTIIVQSTTLVAPGELKIVFTWANDKRVPHRCRGTADSTTVLYKADSPALTLSAQSEPSPLSPNNLNEYFFGGDSSRGPGEGDVSPWKRRVVESAYDPIINSDIAQIIESEIWVVGPINTRGIQTPFSPLYGSSIPTTINASEGAPIPLPEN